MTTSNERYRALIMAGTFLHDLTDPKTTKGIPKEIREKARRILRHYPWPVEIDELAEMAVGVRLLDKNSPNE
jgi:DNA-binding NtrC family response regulator